METIIVEPSTQLLNSMRSIGYSFESAVADILDNSIDAGARNIEVDADVVKGDYVAVLDDGTGMDFKTALEALRIAGTSSDGSDGRLGRFGLGLKTASLSQGRRVTVVSKTHEGVFGLQWDLDLVTQSDSWVLVKLNFEEIPNIGLLDKLLEQDSGTLVIWQKLDLLIGDGLDISALISASVERLHEHLSFTFHRFLGGAKKRCSIKVNGVPVQPLDPFLTGNPKTQISPEEVLEVRNSFVKFTVFTLPHPSGLSGEERIRPDLSSHMRDFQGFYIYRNGRLLSRGHWFGLAAMNELTKQTRIQVDIPSTLDDLWQIDVKKSRAEPPASFKAHLKTMIEPILQKGKRVHTFRGRKVDQNQVSHLWQKFKDREGFYYEVNLENPMLKAALSSLSQDQAERFLDLFQALSRQLPLLDAYQEMAKSSVPTSTKWAVEEIRRKLEAIKDTNVLPDEPARVRQLLSKTEPFDTFDGLEKLVDEIWGNGGA